MFLIVSAFVLACTRLQHELKSSTVHHIETYITLLIKRWRNKDSFSPLMLIWLSLTTMELKRNLQCCFMRWIFCLSCEILNFLRKSKINSPASNALQQNFGNMNAKNQPISIHCLFRCNCTIQQFVALCPKADHTVLYQYQEHLPNPILQSESSGHLTSQLHVSIIRWKPFLSFCILIRISWAATSSNGLVPNVRWKHLQSQKNGGSSVM